jgi:hypothetical protein
MEHWKLYTVLGSIAMLIAISVPASRVVISGIFSKILTPALIASLTQIFLWLYWVAKTLWLSHWTVLRNCVTPRKVLFPSLEDEDPYKL